MQKEKATPACPALRNNKKPLDPENTFILNYNFEDTSRRNLSLEIVHKSSFSIPVFICSDWCYITVSIVMGQMVEYSTEGDISEAIQPNSEKHSVCQ